LVLNNNGQVFSFGNNQFGQLGLGDVINRHLPSLVPSLSNIVKISSGGYFSLALNNNGKVFSFGKNEVNFYLT
jgi:alpha-tubulin suppressor-like RCC1 family protein